MEVWISFLFSPDCPKQPIIEYLFHRFLYPMICGIISGNASYTQISKGQLISKANCQAVNSSKNEQMNSFLQLSDEFSFIFWKKLKTAKRPFKINWPLKIAFFKVENLLVLSLMQNSIKTRDKRQKMTNFILNASCLSE